VWNCARREKSFAGVFISASPHKPLTAAILAGGFFMETYMSMLSDAENTLAVDRVHGTDETAKILNVSKKTLRRLELRGVFGPRIQITERIHGFRDSTIDQSVFDFAHRA
jgi:hypothetical protein